jgi:predicted amidohydrolase
MVQILFIHNSEFIILNCLRHFFAQASEDKDELLIADFDLDMIEEVRNTWQFFRDRRPETYGKLVEL